MQRRWSSQGIRAAAIERIAVAAWLAFELGKGGQILWAGEFAAADALAALALAVMFLNTVRRSEPLAYRADIWTIIPCLIAVAAMALALVHAQERQGGTLPAALEIAGAGLMLWSAVALGKNFTMLPAASEAVAAGPYAFVRHPLYAAYLLFDLGIAIEAQSVLVWGALALEAGALMTRARQEEELLTAHAPGYRAYAARVRWRFAPLVF
jgi:protein-S-isoprenylcysteine O-methyltransferase Ste14